MSAELTADQPTRLSSNAKVIQTVDEILKETTNINVPEMSVPSACPAPVACRRAAQAEILPSNVATFDPGTPGARRRAPRFWRERARRIGDRVSRDVDNTCGRASAGPGRSATAHQGRFLKRVEQVFGTPDSTGSLSARLARATAPVELRVDRLCFRLQAIVGTAKSLCMGGNATSDIRPPRERRSTDPPRSRQAQPPCNSARADVEMRSLPGRTRCSALLEDASGWGQLRIVPVRGFRDQNNPLFTWGRALLKARNRDRLFRDHTIRRMTQARAVCPGSPSTEGP